MNGDIFIPLLPGEPPTPTECPCCFKLAIDIMTRTCTRCGVALPRTADRERADPRFEFKRRPDQSERSAISDYAATKADKA